MTQSLGGCFDLNSSTLAGQAYLDHLQPPAPWEYLSQGGIEAWAGANDTCNSLAYNRSHLALPETLDELDELSDALRVDGRGAWLGLRYKAKRWRRADGLVARAGPETASSSA